MAKNTVAGAASAQPKQAGKADIVDFRSAYMDILAKSGMSDEQLSRLSFQIDSKKTFGPMLALQVLSDVRYPGAFIYERTAPEEGGVEKVELRKELRTVLRYLVSVYAVYSEEHDEADRNNREKIAIERSIATEKTKGRDAANSGRSMDDEDSEGGNGMPGYVEGDVAGVTPVMHTFMNRLENAVREIYGVDVKAAIRDGFSEDAAVDEAVRRPHDAKELADYVTFLVQLRESLPYLDREFSGRSITKDPQLAADAGRIITAVKGELRQDPSYVTREAMNMLFGPDTMSVLYGEEFYDPKDGSSRGEAAFTKINGRLSDRTAASRLISVVRDAVEREPKVFRNAYTGRNDKDDPAGFFLGGSSYNISGVRRGQDYSKMRTTVNNLRKTYIRIGELLGVENPKAPMDTLDAKELRENAGKALGKKIEDIKPGEIEAAYGNARREYDEKVRLLAEARKDPEKAGSISGLESEVRAAEETKAEAGRRLSAWRDVIYSNGIRASVMLQKMLFRTAMHPIQRAVYDERINPHAEESVDSVLAGTYPYVRKGKSGYYASDRLHEYISSTEEVIRKGISSRADQIEMERGVDYKGEMPTELETDSYILMRTGMAYRMDRSAAPEYLDAFREYSRLYRESIESQNRQIDAKNRILDKEPWLFANADDRETVIRTALTEDERKALDSLSAGLDERPKLTEALFNADERYAEKTWPSEEGEAKRAEFLRLAGRIQASIGDSRLAYDEKAAAKAGIDFSENGDEPADRLTDALMLYQESERRVRLLEPLSAEDTGMDPDALENMKAMARENRKERLGNLIRLISGNGSAKVRFMPGMEIEAYRITDGSGKTDEFRIRRDELGYYGVERKITEEDGSVSYEEPVEKDYWDIDAELSQAAGRAEILSGGSWKTIGSVDTDALRARVEEAYGRAFSAAGLNSIPDDSVRAAVSSVAEKRIREIGSNRADDFITIARSVESHGVLTDSVVAATRNLMERNIDAVTKTYMSIADGMGITLDEGETRRVAGGIVRTIWNERKSAAAEARAVETFNSYGVRGLFDDKLDRVEGGSGETINAFRNGTGTFVGLEDISRRVMDTMSAEMEGMTSLYKRYVRLHALPEEEFEKFREAHGKAIAERAGELEKDAAETRAAIESHRKLLAGSFSGARQYDLGMSLQERIAGTDIDALSASNADIAERSRLRGDAKAAYSLMSDTLISILTDARARDITTGELKDVSEEDIENTVFPVRDIALFLIKHDLERAVPGSYTYPEADREFRFMIRMIQESELQGLLSLKSRLEESISHGYEQYEGSANLPDSVRMALQEGLERNRTLQAELDSVTARIALKRDEIAYRDARVSYASARRDLAEAEERLAAVKKELEEIRRRAASDEMRKAEARAAEEEKEAERARAAAEAAAEAARALREDALAALRTAYAVVTGRDADELESKGIVPKDDSLGIAYIPDSITPKCITDWLRSHMAYQSYLREKGTDARFEEFRREAEAFIANNPVDRFSVALKAYLDSVDGNAPEEERRKLFAEAAGLAETAPYMGREAKLLHEADPEATREDVIAAADSFGSDRKRLMEQDKADRKRLAMLDGQISMLRTSPDVFFVMAGAAVPDYREEQLLLKDDIATESLLHDVPEAISTIHTELSKAYRTRFGKDWEEERKELSSYMTSLYGRMEGKHLDEQMDMLRTSALVSDIRFLDTNAYMLKQARLLGEATEALRHKLKRKPSEQEIAGRLGWQEAKVRNMLSASASSMAAYIDSEGNAYTMDQARLLGETAEALRHELEKEPSGQEIADRLKWQEAKVMNMLSVSGSSAAAIDSGEKHTKEQAKMLDEAAKILSHELKREPSKKEIAVQYELGVMGIQGSLDRNGHWNPSFGFEDPVFSTAFGSLRQYAIALNEGIVANDHHWTEQLTEAEKNAKNTAPDAIGRMKAAFVNAYTAEVRKRKRELNAGEMNLFLKNMAISYDNDVREFYSIHAPLSSRLMPYFRRGGDGKMEYISRDGFKRMISSDPRFHEGESGKSVPDIGKFLEFSELPRTAASIVMEGLFIKDLGTEKSNASEKKNPDRMSADLAECESGSALYGINAKNSSAAPSRSSTCGLIFRTYGKGSISKEAVLAMLAMRTGTEDALRSGKFSEDDLKIIRRDLNPSKWETVTVAGAAADGVAGLMMLIPKEPLSGIRTAEFIKNNPLYVTEGAVRVTSGMSLDGISEMRSYMASKLRDAESSLRDLDGQEAETARSRIESYKLELKALDDLERAEKDADARGTSVVMDREAVKAFISSGTDSRNSEFIASFDEMNRYSVESKAISERNSSFDSDRAMISAAANGKEFSDPFGSAPRKMEGAWEAPTVEPSGRVFFSSEGLRAARMEADPRVDNPMKLRRDPLINDTERLRRSGFVGRVRGVKEVFDIAFRPIDDKGTPLYKDPEKFGFLLSFIRDNYRSDKPLSFVMTGGPLLDEAFVAEAGNVNLYQAIRDGEGENEISYLVYRMMFDAANVSVGLNSRNIVKMEVETEDISTDDALDMSQREEDGSRLEGDESVEKSVYLEHFPGILPEYNEYGMNQDAESVQRMFAYENRELARSIPDTAAGSIYGRLSLPGIGRFEETFRLVDDYTAGRATADDKARLSSLVPESTEILGRTDIDITADNVRSWFEAWNDGRDGDIARTAPLDIDVSRKLLAIRSLLPLCGPDQAGEGTECRNSILREASEILATDGDREITWPMLVAFHDAVSEVDKGRDGLPDYSHVSLDDGRIPAEMKEALAPVMSDSQRAGRLYRLLATAGMRENVIPENMQDVIGMLSVNAEKKMSVDEYVRLFSTVFHDQLEEYRASRAFTEYFTNERNAGRLEEAIGPILRSGADPEKALDEMRSRVGSLLDEPAEGMFRTISISTVPYPHDSEEELSERIAIDIAKAAEKTVPGIIPADVKEPSKAIAASLYADARMVSKAIDSYVSGEMKRAAAEGRPAVISIRAAAERAAFAAVNSRYADSIASTNVVAAILRDISEAKRNHEYIPQLPGHDIKAIVSSAARHLAVEGGYIVKAARAEADSLAAGVRRDESSRLISRAVEELSLEQWAGIAGRLADVKLGHKGEEFLRCAVEARITPSAVLADTYGLRENLDDAVARIAGRVKTTSYNIRMNLVNSGEDRMRDMIASAKALPAGSKAKPMDIMKPVAFFPVAGSYVSEPKTGREGWHFYSQVPVYSEARASELRKALERYADSPAISAAIRRMDKLSEILRSDIAKGVPAKELVGEEEYRKLQQTADIFSGLTSDEISLLPDDISLIPMDGFAIEASYASDLHETAKEEEKARAEIEKNRTKTEREKLDAAEHEAGPVPESEEAKAVQEDERTAQGRSRIEASRTRSSRRSEAAKAAIEQIAEPEKGKGSKS